MGKTTIAPDNLAMRIDLDVGITLASGKVYPQGQIVTSVDGVTWTDADIILSTIAGYNTQTVYVLAAEVDATAANAAGVGYTGEFNSNVVALPGVQTIAQVGGILQAKNITLKDWSK